MSPEMLLNGQFVPYETATVAVDDRGFQFAESVYELMYCYRGRPFEMDRHMRRFSNSAEAIGLTLEPGIDVLKSQIEELLKRSGLQEAVIYIQATTGAAPRAHLRPAGLKPTVIVTVGPKPPIPERWRNQGLTAITVPDERWARCYVKTTMLLPNTMARKKAVEAGCDDAIFVRDGFVTEATAANAFAVFNGELRTAAKSNYILHGVTREVVLELAAQLGIPSVEGPIPVDRLYTADEVFITGTTFGVAPIVSVDGKTIGDGRPGPVAARLHDAYWRKALGD